MTFSCCVSVVYFFFPAELLTGTVLSQQTSKPQLSRRTSALTVTICCCSVSNESKPTPKSNRSRSRPKTECRPQRGPPAVHSPFVISRHAIRKMAPMFCTTFRSSLSLGSESELVSTSNTFPFVYLCIKTYYQVGRTGSGKVESPP